MPVNRSFIVVRFLFRDSRELHLFSRDASLKMMTMMTTMTDIRQVNVMRKACLTSSITLELPAEFQVMIMWTVKLSFRMLYRCQNAQLLCTAQTTLILETVSRHSSVVD